jgi:hypothetical protein
MKKRSGLRLYNATCSFHSFETCLIQSWFPGGQRFSTETWIVCYWLALGSDWKFGIETTKHIFLLFGKT